MRIEDFSKISRLHLWFSLCCLIFIAIACASPGPIEKYPDFVTEKALIDKINILSDFEIYESGLDGDALISDEKFKELSDSVMNYFINNIKNKGYFINDATTNSTLKGIANSGLEIRNSENQPEQLFPIKSRRRIGKQVGPVDYRKFIYIDPNTNDLALTKYFPNYKEPIDSLAELKVSGRINAVAILSIRGAEPSAGKAVLSGALLGLASGNSSLIPKPILHARFWLIEQKTRKIIWYDSRYEEEFYTEPKEISAIMRLVKPILEDLPGPNTNIDK